MRGLDSILNQLQISLQTAASPLTDFTPQGVTYTLMRSIASGIQAMESNYDSLLEQADFTIATGAALESFANLFGLSRQAASFATGSVLVTSSSDILLSAGLIFTDLQTGQQYISNNPNPLTATPFVEIAVPIISAFSGNGKALLAGTKLYSQFANITDVSVGFERKYDGTACGNMNDGGQLESDGSLRLRMYALIRAGGLMNQEALRALLIEHPAVSDVLIYTVSAGIVKVLIKSDSIDTSTLINDLTKQIEQYLVAVAVEVQLQSPTPIQIDLRVQVADTTNLNELKSTIKNAALDYIQTVRTSLYFDPRELEALISPYVETVQINLPLEPLEWNAPLFLELGDLNVNFKI